MKRVIIIFSLLLLTSIVAVNTVDAQALVVKGSPYVLWT